MSPRARFAAESILYAAVLYALLRGLTTSWPDSWWFGYSTAAVAVMLAAQGVSWVRKLLFAGVTAALLVLLFEVVAHSFILSFADALRTLGTRGANHLSFASFVVMQVLFLGVPLTALALFVGKRPSVLWTRPEAPRSES